MNVETNIKGKVSAIAFGLFFPIAGAIRALRNPKSETFVALFTIFYGFLGLGIWFSFNDGSDVSRYAIWFLDASKTNLSFWQYYDLSPEGNKIDFYLPFMTWLISRFTNDYRVYLCFLTSVNGFFIGCNVSYIAKKSLTNSANKWLLILLALVSNPIFITHRWWTALNIFLFGTIRFLIDKNYKMILVACSAFLVHFSFIYPLIILFITPLIPSKTNLILLVTFCVFSLMDTLELNSLNNLISLYMPDAIASRTDMYINYELQEHNFLSLSVRIIFKFLNIIMAIVLFMLTKNDYSFPYKKLYTACLIFGIMSSISGFTEYGWRYFDLSNFLFVSLYILMTNYYNTDNFLVKFKISLPFFIYIIIYQIRSILDGIGPISLLFGNYFTIWIIEDNISVLGLIKQLLL